MAEIWMFELNPKKGREQRGVRPCLIVSTDALNRSDFGTVIICPVTTTERPRFKWRVAVAPGDLRLADTGWQPKPHWVEPTRSSQWIQVTGRYVISRRWWTRRSSRSVDEFFRMMLDL